MPKRREKLTRLGLPAKTAKVIFAVTPEEKAEIQAEAKARRQTVTDYLLGLHRQHGVRGGGRNAR